MIEKADCIVIGAGVVGLAVARQLAMDGRDVIILEAEEAIGTGISSRNSEVIHAGIYYEKDSLKARLCVAGKQMLYAYCASHGVPHQRLGKLIVASEESQINTLREIGRKAAINGVEDMELLGAAQLHDMEPALRASGALLSPSSGIIDTHALMLAYQGDAARSGHLRSCFGSAAPNRWISAARYWSTAPG